MSAPGLTKCLSLGTTCEVVLAPCAPSPCKNSGVCRESEDYESFSCICPSGWQGEAGLVPTELGRSGEAWGSLPAPNSGRLQSWMLALAFLSCASVPKLGRGGGWFWDQERPLGAGERHCGWMLQQRPRGRGHG